MVAVENIHTVYVKLENRPGTLARAAKAIADKKINIESLALETVGGTGFARISTPRFKDTIDALRAANVEAYESQSLLVSAPNKPGELSRICSELGAAGINVESVLTTPDHRIALRTSDNERAAQIVRKL